VPDFAERTFYVSGPQPMVSAVRRTLRRMGVPFWRIRTDFFPGLA
jgi:ferredoxin-NADP reductase